MWVRPRAASSKWTLGSGSKQIKQGEMGSGSKQIKQGENVSRPSGSVAQW